MTDTAGKGSSNLRRPTSTPRGPALVRGRNRFDTRVRYDRTRDPGQVPHGVPIVTMNKSFCGSNAANGKLSALTRRTRAIFSSDRTHKIALMATPNPNLETATAAPRAATACTSHRGTGSGTDAAVATTKTGASRTSESDHHLADGIELGPPPKPPLRLLLIEDDDVDVEFLQRVLRMSTSPLFEVVARGTLADSTEALGSQDFDVVLMDLGLPDSAGLESLQRLRAYDAKVPIVVLTGLENEDVALEAIESGAQDYLSKINLSGLTLIRALKFSVARQTKFLGIQATADLDPLTGLPNRRGLESHYQSLRTRSMATGQSLFFCILDLDHFKSINDRFGHFVGDVVLQNFADRMNTILDEDWMVARFGGEEFCLFVPDHDGERVRKRIDGFLDRLASQPMRIGDVQVRLTCSSGLIRVGSCEHYNEAYVRCDQLLYRAKREGRNRLVTDLHVR